LTEIEKEKMRKAEERKEVMKRVTARYSILFEDRLNYQRIINLEQLFEIAAIITIPFMGIFSILFIYSIFF
jgi:hypothetical protein